MMRFNIDNVGALTIGVDNSDSDKFKISGLSSVLGTNDRLTIDTSGNVGIGTTSPEAPLHISGSNSGDPYAHIKITGAGTYPNTIPGLIFDNVHGHQSHIRFLDNGAVKFQIRYNHRGVTQQIINYTFTVL